MLLQTVQIFDSVGWYVYAAIFAAMVFGIANVLLMAVFERIREIEADGLWPALAHFRLDHIEPPHQRAEVDVHRRLAIAHRQLQLVQPG